MTIQLSLFQVRCYVHLVGYRSPYVEDMAIVSYDNGQVTMGCHEDKMVYDDYEAAQTVADAFNGHWLASVWRKAEVREL